MRKIYLKSLTLLSLFVLTATSCTLISSAGFTSKGLPTTQVPEKLTSTTANSTVNLDHSGWTKLLEKHVDAHGNVNYKAFKNDRQELDSYLNMLSENMPVNGWSVQEQLAYYINLYNAYTVDLILKNYPIKSIKDLSAPWTKAFVPVGDVMMSLGGIENSILRKMNEPRIHFAINCASMSCPKLLNEAFTAEKIDEQLDRVTWDFINSDKNNIKEDSAQLSSILDWYEKDYLVRGVRSIRDYVNQYSAIKIKKKSKITFGDYNWNLNEQK